MKIPVLLLLAACQVLAQAPQGGADSIAVRGDVATPLTLTATDLSGMPRQTVTVEEEDGSKVSYEGVLLRDVLAKAGAPVGNKLRGKALATYIVAKAKDGYQVVFTPGEIDASFGNTTIIIADRRDGKPLFGYQGPFRLTIPGDKAGARSVRMLESIEIVRLAK